ncbi:Guanine nucleotide-binding protein, beta subunit [Parasponia andersonii]|uniref:Guanine nucleotide-binding protein, beta subunit n=1 Tax=Parasponia andersonii TaxID=3476 RepID=A0A2P5DQW8_PARAD|nr:Guanine nucleotide-binding protein, beta subunit [Parasponia andersonii]
MISAISWVPKGASKPVPSVADLPSKEEIEEIVESGGMERSGDSDEDMDDQYDNNHGVDDDDNDDDGEKLDKPAKSSKDAESEAHFEHITNGLKELDMDHYDDEDDGFELFSKGLGDLYYQSNDLDPYLKDKDGDEDSEDLEDLTIRPMDAVIVWVCEEPGDDGELNTYVHHEIMIFEFPLCTAWMDCPLKGGDRGSFLAVGSMEPSIEIWDLDVIDEVQPCMVLGGIAEKKKKKKKKGKKKETSVKYKEGSHTDSVLGLAWNKQYRNVLASASADKTVKIWDVAAGKCDITLEHHSDKVQAVAWNYHAPQVLLSGSFDHSMVMRDGRMPSHSGYKWLVNSDVESLAWDPHTEYSFVVSLEDGTVKGFDIRAATSDPASESQPSFTLHAHDKAVCSISYNSSAPNLLATGSMDKMVKLWDLSNNQPSCIASKNPKAGAVFSVSFSEDSPFLLAIGGSKGKLQMWDTLSDSAISRRFGNYRKPKSQPVS